jgi:tetratricopeptide (TPR) repeat protein
MRDQKQNEEIIDLGEDLLEEKTKKSIVLEKKDKSIDQNEKNEVSFKQETAEDFIKKAEILLQENFVVDAKKLIRKALILFKEDSIQKKCFAVLNEIEKRELEELLGKAKEKNISEDNYNVKSEHNKLLKNLEKDFLFNEPNFDENTIQKMADDYLKLALNLSPKNRLDLGIAFYEMGIFKVAQVLFQSVVRYDEYKVQASALLAQTLIDSNQAMQAILILEPLVRDLTIKEEEKIELLYLMGLSFESLNDSKRAKEFFNRVYTLNKNYRNIFEKI